MPLPPPPDRNTWRALLTPALRVIDSLEANGYGRLDFRLGGGTVLMLRFDHRLSKDIDIFTYDAQALGFLSPRLNAVAEQEAGSYEEHANVIKLILPEGDIDFIVAGPVILDAELESLSVDGRMIPLDATSEILAKKLLYRAESFKARDVFDLSTALALDPAAAHAALRATTRTRSTLDTRLADLARAPVASLEAGLLVTDAGRPHADRMVERVRQAIADLDRTRP